MQRGKRELVVTVMTGAAAEEPKISTKSFPSTNRGIEDLRRWLSEEGCMHAVMESTGSYWKPVFHKLEGLLKVLLANPAHVKNLRGHKTGCKDSQWLAHLLRHGMVRASFIPPEDIRQLRDLTRRRKRLRGNGASEKNRLAKVLEDANIKRGSVMSSLFGASGQAMLERMLKGDFHAGEIAELAQGSLKGNVEALAEALEGHRMNRRHRFLVQQCINHLRFLEEQVAALDVEIGRLLEPYREVYELLQTMPGVRKESAAVLLAEAGADMSVFPTPEQFTSWAGLCPGAINDRRPNPRFGVIRTLQNDAVGRYNGLSAVFRQNGFKGLTMMTSYTWSKMLDMSRSGVWRGQQRKAR
jgi:transposase